MSRRIQQNPHNPRGTWGIIGRARVLQPFALGNYGLLGARGIRLSWSALRGKKPLLCWQGSLGVVALAPIGARRRKKETWSRSPARPSSTQEKRNLVS
jgi:hypothetical protein